MPAATGKVQILF